LLSRTADAPRDGELAARIQSGDPVAEELLVNQYRRSILLIATVRTRDREAAHDLSQEILMAVLQALRAGQLREAEKLSAFIHGTARNLINNFLRTRSRRAECSLDVAGEPARDSVEEQEFQERRRLVRQELESCNILDQKILLYSMVDGHSLAEVAERVGITHDAVRARKSRVVKRVMKKFAGLSQK
jgi:RNA polymerase sigma factor (sigma-70 family)